MMYIEEMNYNGIEQSSFQYSSIHIELYRPKVQLLLEIPFPFEDEKILC